MIILCQEVQSGDMSIVEGEYCTWAQSPNMGFSTELASTEVFSHCNMVIVHSELSFEKLPTEVHVRP